MLSGVENIFVQSKPRADLTCLRDSASWAPISLRNPESSDQAACQEDRGTPRSPVLCFGSDAGRGRARGNTRPPQGPALCSARGWDPQAEGCSEAPRRD